MKKEWERCFGHALVFRGSGPGVAGFGAHVIAALSFPPSTPGYFSSAPSARKKGMRESPAGHRGVVVKFVGDVALRGLLHLGTPFSFVGAVPG